MYVWGGGGPARGVGAAEVPRARARLQQAGRHAPPVRASTACSPARTHTSVCTPDGGPCAWAPGMHHAWAAATGGGAPCVSVRAHTACSPMHARMRARPCVRLRAPALAPRVRHVGVSAALCVCVCASADADACGPTGVRVCVRACVRTRAAGMLHCICAGARAFVAWVHARECFDKHPCVRECVCVCSCKPVWMCGHAHWRDCTAVWACALYVHARACARVCVCGCTCVHGHACGDERRLCAGVRGRLLACWPARVHACRRAFLFVDVCSSINVLCVCVCVCAHAGVHDCVPTGARVRVCLCGRALVCGGVWAWVHVHGPTLARVTLVRAACAGTYTRVWACTRTLVCARVCQCV